MNLALTPLLRGEARPAGREFLFREMNFYAPDFFSPQRTARDARPKLLLDLRPPEGRQAVELFDLATDPWETNLPSPIKPTMRLLGRRIACSNSWFSIWSNILATTSGWRLPLSVAR